MNNLNDPDRWNIMPEPQGGADWGKWNFALLVPWFGLAAFHWIRTRESEKQVLEVQQQLQKELEDLKQERRVLRRALEQDKDWQQRARVLLQELVFLLEERQHIFCSPVIRMEHRQKVEYKLRLKAAEQVGAELGLEKDLDDIFINDRHCADLMNTDRQKNGKLMWLYLEYWKLKVTLHKYKGVEEAINGMRPDTK